MAKRRTDSKDALEAAAPLGDIRAGKIERPFLESTLAGLLRDGEVVAICADPGMGKTQLALRVSQMLACDEVAMISLTGFTSEMASDRMLKESARISQRQRRGKTLCAVIDDICACDECDVEIIGRAVQRLHRAGVAVIMTLRPEASQLFDVLDSFVRVGKGDLMMRAPEIGNDDRAHKVIQASGGVPTLVDALSNLTSVPSGTPLTMLPAYGEALCDLVRSVLRDSLVERDRIMRFTALILGTGGFEELEELFPGETYESIELAIKEAPLIEMDHITRTFRCIGLEGDAGLVFCSDVLADAARMWPRATGRAYAHLAERGSLRRSAQVSVWLESDAAAPAALKYGMGFLGAGETAVVRGALAAGGFVQDVSPYAYGTLSLAHDALFFQVFDPGDDLPAEHRFATQRDETDADCARLLALSRAQVSSTVVQGSFIDPKRTDQLAITLALHAEAQRLLFAGHISQAYALLMANPQKSAHMDLGSALLCIDREVAAFLMCDGQSGSSERIRESERFFERMGLVHLAHWSSVLASARHAFLGVSSRSAADAGDAASTAERRGDDALAAALSCLAVAADLKKGAHVSAHVRAANAMALAEQSQRPVLSDIALILSAIAATALQDAGVCAELARRRCSSAQLSDIARLVCAALTDEVGKPVDGPVPNEYLWLVKGLCGIGGSFSSRFTSLLPAVWRRRVGELGEPEKAGDLRADAIAEQHDASTILGSRSYEQGIDINVLGGFSLFVNGSEIPEGRFEARHAKTLLAYLAATPQHRISRINLIESLWPETDLYGGLDRIYQATSRIRHVVHEFDAELDPIGNARNDGIIGLRTEIVRCDVDTFLTLARGFAGKDEPDEKVVESAQRIAEIYRGDLYVPPRDVSGTLRTRSHEYRKLFVDAMVLGSEAAQRLGRYRVSVHLAEAAYTCDARREDVVCAFIRALRSAGRNNEATSCYRVYAKWLARRGEHTVPHELRAAAGNLFDGFMQVAEAVR